jgi:hypothetical protein
MTLTTYGYKLVSDGDLAKGASGWFAMLNYNTSRFDAHNHDGVSSALLALSALSPYTGTVLAAGWVVTGSTYKQTITVPAGVTEVNNYNVKFIFTAPAGKIGEIAYLHYDRLTATTYEVFCNDNTAAFTAVYR